MNAHEIRIKQLNEEVDYLSKLEKENAVLKEQIEKMKCCQNCADGKSCENSGLVLVCEKWRFEK